MFCSGSDTFVWCHIYFPFTGSSTVNTCFHQTVLDVNSCPVLFTVLQSSSIEHGLHMFTDSSPTAPLSSCCTFAPWSHDVNLINLNKRDKTHLPLLESMSSFGNVWIHYCKTEKYKSILVNSVCGCNISESLSGFMTKPKPLNWFWPDLLESRGMPRQVSVHPDP